MAVPGKNPKKRIFLKTATCLALLIAVIIADSALRLTVSRFEPGGARLPEGFDGFRIVQLSDFHGAQFGRDGETLVNKVLRLDPDIVVLTGDFISNADDLPAVSSLVSRLRAALPVYFVSGNHDWASGAVEELFDILEGAGVICLRNEYVELIRNGDSIILCGVEDPNSWSDLKTPDEVVAGLRLKHPDSYVVLLGHRNYWVERYPSLDVDLILCGHSHGGIVRLPFVGGLIDASHRFPARYDAGVFFSGGYSMIVSRGIGSAPIPRFLNNPEIVCVTLSK